jgi:homoserine dehydrogenase
MPDEKTELKIALVGCGTVGSAVAVLLGQQKEIEQPRSDVILDLKYIVDVDFARAESCGIDPGLFCRDYQKALDDPQVGVVVELIGGIEAAKSFIRRALEAGKHVVTANKALIASHGAELMALARKKGLSIGFEASCAGGIPIVRAITDGLIANRISALYGILNGTCNYILTEMTQKGKSYGEALAEAQHSGLAEADPTLDVSGLDTAHKLAILASLAFGESVQLDSIPVTGIDDLQVTDVAYGQELGYVIKLLAIAKRYDHGLSLCVRPAFISVDHPLAWVSGSFNAVSIYGHATGHTLYYGRGAGGAPTSSAVVSDIYAVATGAAWIRSSPYMEPGRSPKSRQLAMEDILSRYYLRIICLDAPGVLAKIAACLGDQEISIRSVLQKEPPGDAVLAAGVPVVITTHTALEGSMLKAIRSINSLPEVKGDCVYIDIVDEGDES